MTRSLPQSGTKVSVSPGLRYNVYDRHHNRMYERNERTGSIAMNLRKILIWVGVALVLFFLISAPQQASGLVDNILGGLRNAAQAVITFVRSL